MIKEICTELRDRLQFNGDLPYIDVYAGLVQTVQYKQTDANDNPITKRMPVSYDTNIAADCGGPEKALTPDSRKKGIIYFEDNGGVVTVKELSGGRTMYRANLMLVCWLNRKRITDDTYAVIGKNAFDGIKAKLLSNLKPSNYTNLKVNINRFRQEPNIFSKYSYDETVLQFLRPPFEYFAIELTASFITTCATEININPNNC